MVIVYCEVCRKEVKREPWKLRRNKNNYCSRACYYESLKGVAFTPSKRTATKCANCGEELLIKNSRYKKAKNHFCSFECKGKYQSKFNIGKNHPNWKRIKVMCEWCKTTFYARTAPSRVGRERFCSKKCMYVWNAQRMRVVRIGIGNPNWRGGSSYEPYPLEFNNELKLFIRKRDDYACQICEKSELEVGTLHIHHIDKDKKNCATTNLVSLCIHCHISQHRKLVVTPSGGLRVPTV